MKRTRCEIHSASFFGFPWGKLSPPQAVTDEGNGIDICAVPKKSRVSLPTLPSSGPSGHLPPGEGYFFTP